MICGRCRADKPTTEFYKNSGTKSGFARWCKHCIKAYRKAMRLREVDLSKAVIQRFSKMTALDPHKGYLVWAGPKDKDGYGLFGIKERTLKAHRVAWMIKHGPIPPGMCVLHKNDDPECVDVDQLFLGTVADNNLDKKKKGRGVIGGRNGMSVLAENRVMGVISQRKSGATLAEIAKNFGISVSEVHHICSGYTWSHLTGIPNRRHRSQLPYLKKESD